MVRLCNDLLIKTPDLDGEWSTKKPTQNKVPGYVHEAATLWMGDDPSTSVVDLQYRPHGINNVFITGAAIFPSSGSWNPTLTMCGFAQDLARQLAHSSE